MAAHSLYRTLLRRPTQFPRLRAQAHQRRAESSKPGAQAKEPGAQAKEPGARPREDGQIPVAHNVPTLRFWQRLGPLTRAAEAYARYHSRRPYTTQVCASLVIYLCADLSAQSIGGKEYEAGRTARSLAIGAIAAIPGYRWFVFLSRHFNYASRIASLGTKVVVNQLCFTPVFNSYFFGMQALLGGDSLVEAWERIKRTVPVSFVNSWKLWPAVTAVNFAFIPLAYRSIFAGVVAVGWQTYLTYLNRTAENEETSRRETTHVGHHTQPQVARMGA